MKKLIDYKEGEALDINVKDLVRDDERSYYNNNYYHLNNEIILVKSVDDNGEANVYLEVDGKLRDLMGVYDDDECLYGVVGRMYY